MVLCANGCVCIAGPCPGRPLLPVPFTEAGGNAALGLAPSMFECRVFSVLSRSPLCRAVRSRPPRALPKCTKEPCDEQSSKEFRGPGNWRRSHERLLQRYPMALTPLPASTLVTRLREEKGGTTMDKLLVQGNVMGSLVQGHVWRCRPLSSLEAGERLHAERARTCSAEMQPGFRD